MKSNAAISTLSDSDLDDGPSIAEQEGSSLESQQKRLQDLLPKGYSLIKELGSGSVGSVFHCSNPVEGDVAVKVLFPESAADDRTVERFRREFGAYLEINHPNVIRGKRLVDERDRGILALVMELISGSDLRTRLENGKPLSIFEALGLLIQLCNGLQAIHDHGIIHRDLKPENILIDPCGRLKITDFGIALLPGTTRITEHGGMVGTLQYASPEYLMSSTLHPPGDIYALGLIAYEMVTGRPPLEGSQFYESVARRMKMDSPPPSEQNPNIPPWLDTLILKALARDPQNRYRTIDEVLDDLMRGISDANIPIAFGNTRQRQKENTLAEQSTTVIEATVTGVTTQETIKKKLPISTPKTISDKEAQPTVHEESTPSDRSESSNEVKSSKQHREAEHLEPKKKVIKQKPLERRLTPGRSTVNERAESKPKNSRSPQLGAPSELRSTTHSTIRPALSNSLSHVAPLAAIRANHSKRSSSSSSEVISRASDQTPLAKGPLPKRSLPKESLSEQSPSRKSLKSSTNARCTRLQPLSSTSAGASPDLRLNAKLNTKGRTNDTTTGAQSRSAEYHYQINTSSALMDVVRFLGTTTIGAAIGFELIKLIMK